ncbi:hypothetical protein ACWAT4_12235 [Bradyrhizobium manausense]
MPAARNVPALDCGVVWDEIDLLEWIAINADVKANGFGHINLEKLAKAFDFINFNVQVTGSKLDAAQTYATGFLPQTPILADQK